MVGSNGTMIAIRLVRSKLRKREEHQQHQHPGSVHPEQVQQCPATTNQHQPSSEQLHQQNGGLQGHVNQALSASTTSIDSTCCPAAVVATAGGTPGSLVAASLGNGCPPTGPNDSQTMAVYTTTASAEQFIWQFPPPYPPPNTPPPQYTLYNDQDTLVHGLQSDRQGFAKGFRKNLGGRWRRFVKRKPETETCAIPPELKDQLKTIYVY